MTTPTHFSSEYEILNWLSRQEDFAQGVNELRAALAEGRLDSGRGLVEKWLSVYDDVTAGRVVNAPAAAAAAMSAPAPVVPMPVPAPVAPAGLDAEQQQEVAARRADTLAMRSMVQEAQLWAEAAREAAARADAASERLAVPARRAARWGRVAVVLVLLLLVLAGALAVLFWPVLEPQLRALLPALHR